MLLGTLGAPLTQYRALTKLLLDSFSPRQSLMHLQGTETLVHLATCF